jgi:hypothetical protein
MGQGWFALEPARVHTEGQFPCFFVRKAPGHFGGMTAHSWSHGVELVGVVPEKTIWFDSLRLLAGDIDEAVGALNRVEIACEECEVPFWPAEER